MNFNKLQKAIAMVLFCLLWQTSYVTAQTEVSGGTYGDNRDVYIINADESNNDAAVRLQSKDGSIFNDWMIFNENGDGHLYFSNWRSTSHSNANENDIGSKLFIFRNGSTTGNFNQGELGINVEPFSGFDLQYGYTRTGSHPVNRPMYITGNMGEFTDGIEFRHYNGTQGIGFGYNTIYAAGSNSTQNLNLLPKGSGGYVGVGKINPAYKLDVNGPVNATQFRINGTPLTPTTYSLWGQSGNNLEYSSGNVGIGVAPSQRLDVNGNANVRGNIILPNTSGAKSIYTWSSSDTNWRIGMNQNPGFTRSLVTAHTQFMTYAGGSGQGFAVGVNNGNSSFEVRGSDHQAYFRGKVGIGTTSLSEEFHVNGRMKLDGNTAGMWIEAGSSDWFLGRTGENLRFNRGGVDRMIINTSGNVGIGISNPGSYRLNVAGAMRVEKAVRFDCDNCGSSTAEFGTSNWGDLVIQGRVLSTSTNLHLSPPGGAKVIINDTYRSAGGATTGHAGLSVSGETVLAVDGGSVGIGKSNPSGTYKLDVAGNTNTTQLYVGGNRVIDSNGNWVGSPTGLQGADRPARDSRDSGCAWSTRSARSGWTNRSKRP